MVIIIGASRLGQSYFSDQYWVALIVGFLIAWIWFSQSSSRWYNWALQKGADPERLQRWSERTGLLWPKGSVFEKRESRDRK